MNKTLLSLGLIAPSSPAFAHVSPGAQGSFVAGFGHPFLGLDHVLAMVTVGLWASLMGGRAIWMVPGGFVAAMILGFGVALAGLSLPMIEPMIVASTIVLGLVVATALRVDARMAAAIVGAFAIFHGFAHGTELGGAGAMQFGLGFVLATALLHAAGIGIGLLTGHMAARLGTPDASLSRGLGALAAVAGVALAIG